ncbi:hypothetical protein BJY04DRAFT_213267 [Aspergillus karnatakaensis]|uniref:uncharacterized protein n=1 Tax=Aspergillus karnatakaensis TaxID=1810916 RepID=UPI003CCD6D28
MPANSDSDSDSPPRPHNLSYINHPPTARTTFDTQGCTIYGYPSTGGILIKEANLVDMLFLSLPRFSPSQRATSTSKEDAFCELLRRTGATLWPRTHDYDGVQVGFRERAAAEEEEVVVYGWPTAPAEGGAEVGAGVWVLRFANRNEIPRDFGKIDLAMSMEERIEVMKEFGATFFEDVKMVEGLSRPLEIMSEVRNRELWVEECHYYERLPSCVR